MSRAFDLRKPCACGSATGRIENKNGQACIYCAECDKYQYNAPRAEVDRYRQSVVDDLAAFLNARLDEDEEVARATRRNEQFVHGADRWFASHGNAITSMAPHRAITEVGAKRRILGIHGGSNPDPCDAHDAEFRTIPCTTLLLLALPYADHRDYREEWKP